MTTKISLILLALLKWDSDKMKTVFLRLEFHQSL